jgi:hypothetical protein
MPRRAPEELPDNVVTFGLESQSFSPSNPPRRAKNLRSHGKTPINNDVIDVERVAKELTTGLPFRRQSQPGAAGDCYLILDNIEDKKT